MNPLELEALLARRAARYAAAEDDVSAAGAPHLLFERGANRYALPLAQLAGVHQGRVLSRLPGINPRLVGVVQISGQIRAVYDLAVSPLPPEDPWLVVGAAGVVLLADQVLGVEPIDAASLHATPLGVAHHLSVAVGVTTASTVVLDLTLFATRPELFNA
jgi:chemotaxis signal transduction protein